MRTRLVKDADLNARSSVRIFSCEVLIKILLFTITFKWRGELTYNSQISYLTEIRLAFLEILYPYREADRQRDITKGSERS